MERTVRAPIGSQALTHPWLWGSSLITRGNPWKVPLAQEAGRKGQSQLIL